MIERIKKIIEVENIGLVKFANEIGIGSSALSHYLGGRNKVSLELVTKILERFRGINPEWLLFGRGEMYKPADVRGTYREPDLFSASPIVSETSVMAKEAEKTDDSTDDGDFFEPELIKQYEMPLDDNIQHPETQYVTPQKSVKKEPPAIEKIIVMYTDSTFDSYLPNGHKL